MSQAESPAEPTVDAFELYAETRDRLITLVGTLTAEQVELTVPLTSGWTIGAVMAHVCGLNADVAAGRREGLGTDERTAQQVASRAEMSVAAVGEEWLGHGAAMREAIAEDDFFGLRLSADLVVHLHDVQHALGHTIDRNDRATISGGRTYAARTPDRLAEIAGVGVTIELSDGARFEPPAENASGLPALVLRTSAYDFLRSVTGRRSRGQVQALDWSGDPVAVLEHFSPYGPLRTADAEV